MPEQETLPGEQLAPSTGLWARYVSPGHTVQGGEWTATWRSGGYVGTCVCGDYLVPLGPLHVDHRVDYEAHCRAGCGVIVCAPGGRVGSARATERGQ